MRTKALAAATKHNLLQGIVDFQTDYPEANILSIGFHQVDNILLKYRCVIVYID